MTSSWFFRILCTACSNTNNRIVPLTNLNKHLHNGENEIKLNIYNSSEKVKRKKIASIPLKFLFLYIAVRNVKTHRSVLFVVSAINASNLACDNYLSLKTETVSNIETSPVHPTSSSAISSKRIRRYSAICCIIVM